jgi:hypothetical protein
MDEGIESAGRCCYFLPLVVLHQLIMLLLITFAVHRHLSLLSDVPSRLGIRGDAS